MILQTELCAIITIVCGLFQFVRYMGIASKTGDLPTDKGKWLIINIFILLLLWIGMSVELVLRNWY